ncbi:hypothetical protein [Psychromonas sp. Urea-02u-13]|uniref:hypothetical protein n=1 Tax=Psychromonas sp. Urea-02u-13 TaxID=2058326 RepID=UPI000C31D069|nr:hypothetical protein [Psychromonas sp. Urea-02u-13]PKG38482.1 hypothetical protein CXF74_13360 [Psychromonas sp. Urea-02u-13]
MNVKYALFHLNAKYNKSHSGLTRLIKMLQSMLFLVTLLFSLSAQARLPHQLEKVGNGTMSWMFLDIYHASLFTRDGDYSSTVYPQVLTLNYLKNINKKRLVNATKEQWILQGFEDAKMKGWLQSLQKIWPDIKSGDSLTFYVSENKKGFSITIKHY